MCPWPNREGRLHIGSWKSFLRCINFKIRYLATSVPFTEMHHEQLRDRESDAESIAVWAYNQIATAHWRCPKILHTWSCKVPRVPKNFKHVLLSPTWTMPGVSRLHGQSKGWTDKMNFIIPISLYTYIIHICIYVYTHTYIYIYILMPMISVLI